MARVPVPGMAAALLLTALAAGLASCQETEEDTSQAPTEAPEASASPDASASTPTPEPAPTPQPTATPAPVPSDLPAAAEGYEWFVTPANGAFDYGLPLYAVQVPNVYARTPDGAYYGNPEEFVPGDTTRFSSRLIVRVTPANAVILYGFQNELPWQGGLLCGLLSEGELESNLGVWSLYRFKCPTVESGHCQTDQQKTTIDCISYESGAPVSSFDGRAAELRTDRFAYSIVTFQPGARQDSDAAFIQAVNTFTLR